MKLIIKSLFLLSVVISFNTATFAQESLKISTSGNEKLIKALNNSALLAQNKDSFLSVKIYALDNGSGSAGFESCEISHNLLIAVSEFGKNPNQNLFEVGPFLNPQFEKWTKISNNTKEFDINYKIDDKLMSVKLKVDIDKLIKIK